MISLDVLHIYLGSKLTIHLGASFEISSLWSSLLQVLLLPFLFLFLRSSYRSTDDRLDCLRLLEQVSWQASTSRRLQAESSAASFATK